MVPFVRFPVWLAVVLMVLVIGHCDPASAQVTPNVALNKPISGSGPTWPGYLPANLTDGDHTTFTHPQAGAGAGVLGYYFQVDLGQTYILDRIVLWSRHNCCPERLSKYRVEVYADRGGETGPLNWSADQRMDGTFPANGESDTITAAANPGGTFAGRFVRVVNISDMGYNPQMGEIEVYGTRGASVRQFLAEDDALLEGHGTTLRWEVANASKVTLNPGPGEVAASGSLAIQPTATTTYTLVAESAAGLTTAKVTVGVGIVLGPPRIGEFLAENSGGLADDDGDHPDWIELVNTNAFRLNLDGYYLTDDPNDLRKWRLPAARIPSQGRLVVFASGKDRNDPVLPLHTNFKLESKGDYLALVAADGSAVLQQFPGDYPATKLFPRQKANISFGAGTNGVTGFLRPPTPGLENGAAFPGIVADTSFSADRGFYRTNFNVEITCATPDAVIRYTLDRTDPTATSGSIYTAPIVIDRTTILRAAAFRDNWAPSDVDTQTYIFPTNVIASSSMRTSITKHAVYGPQMEAALLDLPSVSLVSRKAFNDTSEVRTSFEWIRPDGQPGIQVDCGLQQYGGAFTDFAKESFRLYFRTEYGAGKLKYPVFAGHDHGLAAAEEFDQLELRNGSHDMEMRGFYMANICTDDTLLEMGHLNPHGRFVHLYINGGYWGVYHLRERWGAAMHQSYLGGSSTNYESINGNWNVGGWADPGTPYDGDGSVWTRIKSLRSKYQSVKPWLDVPEYVDYMLMWMFGGSEDEYRCVGPTVPGSGMKFYLNDADGWFCGPWYCAADDRSRRSSPGRQAGDGPGSLFSTLHAEADPEYRTLLADHIHAALSGEGALTPGRLMARLTNRCNEIGRPFLAESARWNYLTPSAWAGRRDSVLTNWLTKRTTEVLGQWRAAGFYPTLDAPSLNREGGRVAAGFEVRFAGPAAGAIHYTTDGTDPRLVAGAVSPSARTYSAGLTSQTLVPAGSSWRWFTDKDGLGSSSVVAGNAGWSAANWKHPAFDDAGWNEGAAQLGYGENDEITVIPFGPAADKWVSSYFRRRFTIDSTNGIQSLTLRLKRDDGAIVYVNGREAVRNSIRAGEVLASTPGDNASDDGQNFQTLPIAPDLLVKGTNIVAVEMHQSGPTTSDASFDLELVASVSGSAGGVLPVVDRNLVVKARARNGNQWSALHTAFFQTGPEAVSAGDVRITELNFNPLGADDAEFVELTNLSDHAVNLRGARFTNGIDFVFSTYRDLPLAPGQRVVLVKDLFAFRQRYGLDVPVDGIYAGDLSNGGEEIALVGPAGNLVTRFTYDGKNPWPVDADGKGYTLVLANPLLDPSDPLAWRASVRTNGTPASGDSVPLAGDPAADADHDGFAAALEHALGTSDLDPSQPVIPLPALDGIGNLTFSFERITASDDVFVWVEASSDLSTWSAISRLSARRNGDGRTYEVWGAPAGGDAGIFFRLAARTLR